MLKKTHYANLNDDDYLVLLLGLCSSLDVCVLVRNEICLVVEKTEYGSYLSYSGRKCPNPILMTHKSERGILPSCSLIVSKIELLG